MDSHVRALACRGFRCSCDLGKQVLSLRLVSVCLLAVCRGRLSIIRDCNVFAGAQICVAGNKAHQSSKTKSSFTNSTSISWLQTSSLTAHREDTIRCNSGHHVSTSDSQDGTPDSSEPPNTEPKTHAHHRSTSWTTMVMALPLELAAVQSHTDNFYLRKRKRKHWWSKEHFPKVHISH